MATPTPAKPEKKHKKRVRDDETEDGARKHKRSKSEAVREAAKNEQGLKKSPKSKSKYLTPEKVVDSDSEPELDEPPRQVRTQDQEGDESAPQDTETKKHKKEKKEKKEKKKKEKKQREIEQEKAHGTREEYETEKQKSKSKEKSKEKSNDKSKKKARDQSPEPTSTVPGGQGTLAKGSKSTMTTATTQATSSNEPRIPFVTQTISLYIPFFPLGFSRLPSELAAEILDPMVGAFSSALHGILLAYRKAYLSEKPVRASRKAQPVQDEPLMLSTIDECAAGFAWVTAEMDLFCPSRGAAMEGKLALQSEGHIGLVCWGKFNASIEASRLPPGWTWVDTSHETTNGNGDSAMDVDGDLDMDKEPEKEDALDGEGLEQLHSVGYWVDASGMRVTGTLSFRIKDFQLFAGDHQYLSIEGTMLEPAAERELAAKEREAERARRAKQNPNGLLRPMMKRVPDFSMTTIGDDDGEEDLAIAAFQTTTSLTDA